MFLELLTLLILAAVVVVKYLTWRHMQYLREERRTLERSVRETEKRYKAMVEKRQTSEKEFTHLKRDRYGLEAFLQKLQGNLETVDEKNRQLEKLLI